MDRRRRLARSNIEALLAKHGRLPTDAEYAWSDDLHLRADVEAEQMMQWVDSALHFAETVAREPEPDARDIALFWIRLSGVLIDLREHLGQHDRTAEKMVGEDRKTHPTLAPFHALCSEVERLVEGLPEDERFYAEYRRHVECHPLQSRFRARLESNHAHLAPVRSIILDKHVSHAESQVLLRGVLQRYAMNESRIAKAVASQLVAQLRRLAKLMAPLYRGGAS